MNKEREAYKIVEICNKISILEAIDFILLERNITESVGTKGYSSKTAENNKRILDIFKTLYLTIKVSRIEKEELTIKN